MFVIFTDKINNVTEAGVVYKLVLMQNIITVSDNLISRITLSELFTMYNNQLII